MQRIEFSTPVPAALAGELSRRVFYVSDLIHGFELVHDGDAIVGLDLDLAGAGRTDDVQGKIEQLLTTEVLPSRAPRSKVVWQSDVTPDLRVDDLAVHGAVTEVGPGRVVIGEPLLTLIDRLDRCLRSFALDHDGAVEYRYPTMLSTAALDRFGYFGSFPHLAMFATRLDNDFDVYRDFVEAYREGGFEAVDVLSRCRDVSCCLPPTMCYHTFDQFAGTQIPGDRVVTSVGKVFRHEGRYERGLERLWDFTIREIVFLGEPESVEARRRAFLERTCRWTEALGLAGRVELASDHFFASPAAAGKVLAQRMLDLKLELIMPVAPTVEIAVASFNLHGTWFGESFDITDGSGAAISSGCVGFGLERLAYAFVRRHGLDPAEWPAFDCDESIGR